MEEQQIVRKDPKGPFRYQGLRYMFTGICSGIIELGVFQLLLWLTGHVIGSNIIAVACAMTFNFIMSRKFSFRAKGNLARSLALYSTLFLFNMSFTSFLIDVLIETFGWYSPLAKLTGMLCVACWNFPLFRKVIFV